MHQKKLENELAQIQEKHDEKKRKFMDASEEFHREHKKVNFVLWIKSPKLRSPDYETSVDIWSDIIANPMTISTHPSLVLQPF